MRVAPASDSSARCCHAIHVSHFFPLRPIVCMCFPSTLRLAEERLFMARMRLSIASSVGYGVERGRRTTDLVLSLEPKLLVFFLSTFTLIFANSKLTVKRSCYDGLLIFFLAITFFK